MEQFVFILMYIISIVEAYIFLLCPYNNDKDKKRYKRPIWAWIGIVLSTCIPLVNILVNSLLLVATSIRNYDYKYNTIFNKKI